LTVNCNDGSTVKWVGGESGVSVICHLQLSS
jgi:hypothetical protein